MFLCRGVLLLFFSSRFLLRCLECRILLFLLFYIIDRPEGFVEVIFELLPVVAFEIGDVFDVILVGCCVVQKVLDLLLQA